MRVLQEVMPAEARVADLLESIYRVDRVESDWLEGVRQAFVPTAPGTALVQAFLYDASDDERLTLRAIQGGSEEQRRWLEGRGGFAPERATLVRETFGRPAGVVILSEVPRPETLRAVGEPMLADKPGMVDVWNDLGIVDVWAVLGGNLQRRGMAVIGLCTRRVTMPPLLRAHWHSVAAHLSAAYCLREAMAAGLDPTESVLAPGGRRLHAGGDARSVEARQSLRHAVRAIERASARHHPPAGEARAAWQAVVSGRWTLVDQTERDGKRTLLARVNHVTARAEKKLSERETQVLELAVQGLSNKQIGYQLGVGAPAVTNYLKRAAAKLGVANRVDLVRRAQRGAGS